MQYFYFQIDFLSHCVSGWGAARQPGGGPQEARARGASGLRGCTEAGCGEEVAWGADGEPSCWRLPAPFPLQGLVSGQN